MQQYTAKKDISNSNELAQLRTRVAELEREKITRQLATEALRQKEAYLADAQRMARMGICVFDVKKDQMTWSDEFCRLFDIDPKIFSATYQEFMAMVHPEDREFVDKKYKDAVQKREPYEIIHRLLLGDGSIRHVHKLCETVYDDEGNPLRSTGIIQDITERRLAEEALQDSERRFRTIFDSAGDGILIVDGKNRHILDGNPAITELLGYTLDELCTLTVEDIHREEDWHANKEKIELIASGQSVGAFELVFKKKNGSVLYTELTGVPLVIQGTSCVCGIIRDITERKYAEQALYKAHDDLEQEVQLRTAELRKEISQRICTEQALRQSEEQFRSLVGNIPEAIYRCKLDSNWTNINWESIFLSDTMEELSGYPATDFTLGVRTCASIIHPEDRQRVKDIVCEAVRKKQPYTLEFRIIHANGDIRWIAERGRASFNEAGEALWLDGALFDVTEQKRSERQLQESEQRFREMAESINDVFWMTDMTSNEVIYVSPAYERVWGRSRVDLVANARDWVDAVHPDDRKIVEGMLARMVKGETAEVEYRVVQPDGKVRWVWDRGGPIHYGDGRNLCLAGLAEDITERKQAEQRLQESERRFRAMFEQAAVGVAQIESKSGKFMRVNRRYCEIVGYTQEEMKSRTFQDITYSDDLAEDLENMQQLLEGKIRDFTMEKRYLRKDGLLVWVNLTVSPMWASGEEPNYHIAVVEDITKRKRAESERLTHERCQRDTLIREVHHRIKNNLQGVVGLLGQHAEQHPEIAEYLNEALSQLESVALVFGLRSQETSGAIILSSMVEAIANSVQCYVQLPIELSETPKRHPPARIDTDEAVAVALAINELLINAAKHHTTEDNKGDIKVIQLYHAGRVELSIINQGGLLPEFDFEHGRGLGTGLALVKSMLPRKGVDLRITGDGDLVTAQLNLGSPLVQNVGDGWLDQG